MKNVGIAFQSRADLVANPKVQALYDGIVHRQTDLEHGSGLTQRVQTLIPLATDAQGRKDLRIELGDLEASLHVLVANNAYMRRHFDALGVKPDNHDIAADLASTRCVS